MKERLRQSLALGNTKKVIKELLLLSKKLENQDLRDEIILQSSRFELYSKRIRIGTMNNEERNLIIANINNALIQIIDRLPDSQKQSKQQQFLKKFTIAIVCIGLIFISFDQGRKSLIGLTTKVEKKPKDFNEASEYTKNNFSIKVIVSEENEGKKLPFINGGTIFLIFNNFNIQTTIDSLGISLFDQIPAEMKGELVNIDLEIEGYKVINDSLLQFEISKPEEVIPIIVSKIKEPNLKKESLPFLENRTQFTAVIIVDSDFTNCEIFVDDKPAEVIENNNNRIIKKIKITSAVSTPVKIMIRTRDGRECSVIELINTENQKIPISC